MLGVVVATCLLLAACDSADDPRRSTGLPADVGPLPTGAITWASADTIHVGPRAITVERPVRAMVGARGRIYYIQHGDRTLWMTDGEQSEATGYEADEVRASADGRYLGLIDQAHGYPWSTVVVDLSTGEVVVDDDSGMGERGDDLSDLYEDAQPRVLGFDGNEFLVHPASGTLLSWDVTTGEPTRHRRKGQYRFSATDPGGGRLVPTDVQDGRLVLTPGGSTFPGHASPDGSVVVQDLGDRTGLFAVEGGRRLPVDFGGPEFVLGGWTDTDTAYGAAFDRDDYLRTLRLVSCRLSVREQHCRVLQHTRKTTRSMVLFPTGTRSQGS